MATTPAGGLAPPASTTAGLGRSRPRSPNLSLCRPGSPGGRSRSAHSRDQGSGQCGQQQDDDAGRLGVRPRQLAGDLRASSQRRTRRTAMVVTGLPDAAAIDQGCVQRPSRHEARPHAMVPRSSVSGDLGEDPPYRRVSVSREGRSGWPERAGDLRRRWSARPSGHECPWELGAGEAAAEQLEIGDSRGSSGSDVPTGGLRWAAARSSAGEPLPEGELVLDQPGWRVDAVGPLEWRTRSRIRRRALVLELSAGHRPGRRGGRPAFEGVAGEDAAAPDESWPSFCSAAPVRVGSHRRPPRVPVALEVHDPVSSWAVPAGPTGKSTTTFLGRRRAEICRAAPSRRGRWRTPLPPAGTAR